MAGILEPGTPKPSILSRVLGRLFPVDPTFGQFLSPEEQRGLQQQGLLRFGMGLLKAGGPQPKGTSNIGSRIADAWQGVDWSNLVGQTTQIAASMQDRQRKAAAQTALLQALQTHPAVQGETDEQAVARMKGVQNDLISQGFVQEAAELNNIIKLRQPGQEHAVLIHAKPNGGYDVISPIDGSLIRSVDGSAREGETDAARQTRQDLTTRVVKATEDQAVIASGYRTLQALQAQPASPGRDQAILFAFAHILDAHTTLQSIDDGDPKKVHGLAGEALELWRAVFEGRKELSPPQIAKLINIARVHAREAYGETQNIRTYYSGLASRKGLDPIDVLGPDNWYGLGFGGGGGDTDAEYCRLHPDQCENGKRKQ